MTVIDLGLMGIGKIARDQHLPTLAAHPRFALVGTVSGSGGVPGVENHASLAALLAERPGIGALSLCMPPQPRFDIARAALLAGRHVMLEKPPGATVSEVQDLARLAREQGVTLFATWHSRHAAGVAAAKAWAASRRITRVRITWTEDVREWHPGQDWIWQPGGLGVFDPGINALSILTQILPVPIRLSAATLAFPANRDQPIAADLRFAGSDGLAVEAVFDWRPQGTPTWDIVCQAGDSQLRLSRGGAALEIDCTPQDVTGPGEYPALYDRFAALIDAGASDVDLSPLQHVADAFLLGRRETVEPFHD